MEHLPWCVVVRVNGEVDLANCAELEASVREAEASNASFIVISFDECLYLDSTALAVLYRARKRIGSRLRILASAGSRAMKLFDIVGIRSHFDIVESLADIRTTEVA